MANPDKKSVLVTGGANGIGAAIVRTFAKAGYDIAINYNSSRQDAEHLAKECEKVGVKAVAIQADVSDEKAVQHMGNIVKEHFGKLSVLVNNAGLAREADFETIDQEGIVRSFNNVIVSVMLCT